MGTPTNGKSPLPGAQVRARRRVRSALSRKRLHVGGCAARTTNIVNRLRCCSKVSDKLEALKNLIPSHTGEASKPDQLFKETANYIVLLRTQVVILQKLIDFYGSSEKQNS